MQEVWVIAIRLGLPMVILFIIGYLMQHQASTMRSSLQAQDEAKGIVNSAYKAALPKPGQPPFCSEMKACPWVKREKCLAYSQTYLPCWLAVKLDNAEHIKNECLHCALYQSQVADGAWQLR